MYRSAYSNYVYISFQDSSRHLATGKFSAADGVYGIPARFPVRFKFPEFYGIVLIEPADLTGRDSVLKITSYPELKSQAPYCELSSKKYL